MRTRTKIAAAVVSSLLLFTAGLAVKDTRPVPGGVAADGGEPMSAYEFRVSSWLDRRAVHGPVPPAGVEYRPPVTEGCAKNG